MCLFPSSHVQDFVDSLVPCMHRLRVSQLSFFSFQPGKTSREYKHDPASPAHSSDVGAHIKSVYVARVNDSQSAAALTMETDACRFLYAIPHYGVR